MRTATKLRAPILTLAILPDNVKTRLNRRFTVNRKGPGALDNGNSEFMNEVCRKVKKTSRIVDDQLGSPRKRTSTVQ
jgi:hypothetical protein